MQIRGFQFGSLRQRGFASVCVTPVTARTVGQRRGQGKEARGTLILLIFGLLNRVPIFCGST